MSGSAFLGALAESDGTHLGERADRPAAAAADVLDAGDERRGDRSETDAQHPELPLSRRDLPGVRFRHCYASFRERIE